MSSTRSIPVDPVAAKAIKSAQSQLNQLDQELAQQAAQLQQTKDAQAAADAKIDAEEKANPSQKKSLEAARTKLDAKFKSEEKTLAHKLSEGRTQEAALQSKVQSLMSQEQSAQARGFHWAPQIAETAQAEQKALTSDEKKLANREKVDAAAEKQLDAQITAEEKKDPANKAKYEALRAQLQGAMKADLKTSSDKVHTDKANIKELQTEVDLRKKFIDGQVAKDTKAIQDKYAAKIKADGSNKKKVAADKAAEQKALAKEKLDAKTLALRGNEAQADVKLAEQNKAVPNWKNVKAQPPKPKVGYGEPWKPGPGSLQAGDTSMWESDAQFNASIANAKWSAIKATEGTGWTDPTFRARWDKLGQLVKDGKMKLRMAYCFLDAGASGRAQADHFLNTLGIHGKLQPGTRLVLDWEGSALNDPGLLKDAAQRIKDVTGLWPVVYVQGSMMSVAQHAVPNAPIWEAAYGSGVNRGVPFFQYSDGPGYDHDVFNGDLKALDKFAGWTN